MFDLYALARSVLLAFGSGVLLAAPAHAQQASPTAAVEQKETVVITGTRIVSPNVVSNSPISVITAEEIKTDGVRNVEDMLNRLPQAFADQGSNSSNGASGTATVNLRNLGPDRTLVLVNGRRLPAGSPSLYATDLNQIPAALIQRIEVLTGGASAVYGSDAVAGVVNFIMNDRFDGVQLDFNYGFYNHNQGNPVADIIRARNFALPGDVGADGQTVDYSLTLGGNFAGNKGNATLFLGYKKDKALLQAQRDFSSCALNSSTSNPRRNFTCGGSGTSATGLFLDAATGGDNIALTVADAAGNTRDFLGTDLFNFAPYNYYQRPSDRYSLAGFAHYDVAPFARVYSEVGFHDDSTVAQIAPSGLFGLLTTVGFDNPLLSADWRTQLGLNAAGDTIDMVILRRNVEGGGRQDYRRHTSFRGVLGVKGDITDAWKYDAYFHTGRVIYQETYKNDFSRVRAARAMDVIADPTTGQPACRSAVDGTDPNCVPYNIWRLGGVTPAALSYLQTPGFQSGYTAQSVIGATVAGDLSQYGWKVPTAINGVNVALGAERRQEKLTLDTDLAFSTNDLFGQGGATIGLSGQYSVKELFGEIQVPLIEGRSFAELVSLNASYRYSDYSTGVSTDTYGLGLEWAPTKTVRLRGSYQRAVRSANIIELFQAQGLNLYDNDEDPCAGTTPTRSLADCQRTGVTAAQYGTIIDSPAGQYNFLQGGNAQLQPETAKSYTLGLVLTPLPNLSASLDYFHIKVDDVISTIDPTLTLQQCLDSGSSFFCSKIHRDALGTLWLLPEARIDALNENLASWKTSGVDLAVNYSQRIGAFGSLKFDLQGTYLTEFVQEPLKGLGTFDCAGLYGNTCGTPLPEWRHKARVTWATPWKVDLAMTWRHFDSVVLDSTSSAPLLTGPVADVDRKLGSRDYLDIGATWSATNWLSVRAGINNLLDKDPPLTAQSGPSIFGNGNTFPQVYDALGRRVFVGMTAKF